MLRDYRRHGPSGRATAILSALSSRGITGSSVLELGCGFGALTIELLKKGASSATGIDLSPRMLDMARSLAAEAGVSSSVSFRVGDGAVAELPPSDVVVLDAVICCYPDIDALLANSSSAARRYYAVSIPDDRRLMTRLLKLFLPLQGIFRRRGTFRFFIHPTGTVLSRLRDRGFNIVADNASGRIWSVIVFSK